jgi:hypothetical protein
MLFVLAGLLLEVAAGRLAVVAGVDITVVDEEVRTGINLIF